MKAIKFCGLNFKGLTKDILLQETDTIKVIVTANAQFIVHAQKDKKLKKIINNNYTTFDGQVPYSLARMQYPHLMFEKISGSDFIYDACGYAKKNNKKVFLLGGYEKSNLLAIEKLRSLYNIVIDGYSPPYKQYPFGSEHNNKILKHIRSAAPDMLFVGFGAIKQEFWIDANRKELEKIGVKWVVGSGGTFEFVSGIIKRAPRLVQQIGCEGVYRLFSEPKIYRLKRLLFSAKIFMYLKQ
ncbi:MAG: WecB/TagA/CpsF family glycosyltransferase [Proteobacteria bacterium]|nr:WecB/TagA/CpsF family glycosyltransferase [Pseudomonadota bacterium]